VYWEVQFVENSIFVKFTVMPEKIEKKRCPSRSSLLVKMQFTRWYWEVQIKKIMFVRKFTYSQDEVHVLS
jgi:hypothetical protein